MAYWSHHCFATLHFYICISVLCTLLALSIIFPFMLFAPCPFNAPFPFCTFLLLCSASFFTPQSHPTKTTLISSLFCILIVSVLLVHVVCTKLLHPLPISSALPHHHANSSASVAVNACVHHHWVLFQDSFASPVVETLRLLCYK
jgi:hypothetical protein